MHIPPNEINAEIPKLSRNTSYQSLSLVCLQTNLINNKSKENVKRSRKTGDQFKSSVNEMTNAEMNLEKLTERKPKFLYDPHTECKDFI